MSQPAVVRAAELFCGIGGFAEAARDLPLQVTVAIDIDRDAQAVYESNHGPTICRTIESLTERDVEAWQADLWWLSPPCQPYTRRGRQRGDFDNRNLALENVVRLISRIQPNMLAMENVPGFADSRMRRRLLAQLVDHQYHVAEWILCATHLGIPSRRRRYYLVASKFPLAEVRQPIYNMKRLSDFLSVDAEPGCCVDDDMLARFADAIDVVDAADPDAIAACFTRAYGHSPIRSGSYVQQDGIVRRFSPNEIIKLLGFRDDFQWPSYLSTRRCWQLAGNSLSVFAVRKILQMLDERVAAVQAEVKNDW